jgi:hypothetical protein
MATDLGTVVLVGVTGALALRSIVDFAATVEAAVGYSRKAKASFNRAYIGAKIYSRRRSSRLFNFFWLLFTGQAIFGADEDPPPRPPGGGRKARPGPIAFVGYSSRSAEAKVLRAGVALAAA